MTKDTLRETLTSIRNAVLVKSSGVEIQNTRLTKALSKILYEEGFLEKISDSPRSSTKRRTGPYLFLFLKYQGTKRTSIITNLEVVSRPGLRFYTSYDKIPQILGGLGLVILSTSQGLITDREARFRKLGGEVLCSIWLIISLLLYL
jgi:small subunit ribosomal protein S8